MAKTMKIISVISIVLTGVFIILYNVFESGVFFSLSITFGTIAYHFCGRLAVGGLFNLLLKNQVDYNRKWFKVSKTEENFYEKIKIKSWKSKMPTYAPDTFNPKIHSWNEIVGAMCQSELVHETNIVLSFLPLTASVFVGAFPVFLITSVLAAAFDFIFVMMQRYNRPRVIRILERQKLR